MLENMVRKEVLKEYAGEILGKFTLYKISDHSDITNEGRMYFSKVTQIYNDISINNYTDVQLDSIQFELSDADNYIEEILDTNE